MSLRHDDTQLAAAVARIAGLLGELTGRCAEPYCRRPVRLTADGLVPPHWPPAQGGRYCPGSEQPPSPLTKEATHG